jgi:YfiH family protein
MQRRNKAKNEGLERSLIMIPTIQPDWPAPAHIKACTTLRNELTDKPDQTNRPDLKSILSLPSEPIWLKQTHSNIVVEAKLENTWREADASYSKHLNQVCIVLTADCLPILITNKQGTHIASIHAGWRGLANGVIHSTLQALALPGCDLLAWLGPAIGPEKFEVKQDVYDIFMQLNVKNQAAFRPHSNHTWLANLYELATIQLTQLGVLNLYGGHFCTHTQSNLFYSYRREQNKTGRMATLIWMTPPI